VLTALLRPAPSRLQVVQPVFNLMAEQIGLMGEVGEQPALRLGYDDFNESACMQQVRAAATAWLDVPGAVSAEVEASPR
jgi:hypothetical protein